MEYKINEYKCIMDNSNKRLEEMAIVEKIMSLINNKKYDSLELFCSSNKNLQEFKKNNNLNIVLKHFGEKLSQEDYERVLNNLKKLTEQKTSFSTDNIRVSNIDDKQYISYQGKDKNYYFNNSYSFDSFDRQLENLQSQNSNFQTADKNENTERMMNEMSKTKKISLILRYLNEINYEVLNDEQKELFKFVFEYQQKNNGLIRVDLDEKVMVDDKDNIMKLDKVDGSYMINSKDNNSDYIFKSNNIDSDEGVSNQLSISKARKNNSSKGEV